MGKHTYVTNLQALTQQVDERFIPFSSLGQRPIIGDDTGLPKRVFVE